MAKIIKSKKLISVFFIALLCICLGAAFIGMPTSAASGNGENVSDADVCNFVYGDANGDGIVSSADVLLLRKYMANYDYDTGSSTIVLGPPASEPPVTTSVPVTTVPVTTVPVTTAPVITADPTEYAVYYPLYVQEGLVYHLNFAGAKEGITIVGGTKYEDTEALAASRFAAADSNYTPFYAFLREGITNPFSGGTATISEGGWKFVTPYIYGYWYDENGKLLHTSGSVATFDNFVTETGITGVPYYMNGEKYVVADAKRTIDGVTKTTYLLLHRAHSNAIGYYISSGTWGGAHYSSAFGDNYINLGKGNVPTFMNGGVSTVVNESGKYTVDLTVSVPKNSHVTLFMGAPYNIKDIDGVATVYPQGLANSYIVTPATSNFKNVGLGYIAVENVNSYSFTVDATDVANYNVKLGFYGNGASYGTQDLVSQINTFANTWQYAMRNDGTRTYALRVYDKLLTEKDALQNHFADLAIFNKLDIEEFSKLETEEKLYVYGAFKNVAVDFDGDLQKLLDDAIDEVKAPVTTAPVTTAPPVVIYSVSYSANGQSGTINVNKGDSFILPVVEKDGYTFSGYYTGNVQVTDNAGKKLSTYTLSSDITVEAKYTRLPSDADENGEYLGNPNELYYKSTTFTHKIARNPWDMILYNGKLYVGGGYYGGGWVSAPPINTYNTSTGEWSYVDFNVRMYEAFDENSTAKSWYDLPATNSSSNVVVGSIKGIPVSTDCEISNFRWINGKPFALGADSINEYTWADGTVSSKLPSAVDSTDTQKYVSNLSGNYYAMETDENGNDVWVEYRNNVLHGTHVYDVVEIDYNGGKALMFAVGTSGTPMPVKILTNKDTKTYITPKFYLKDGTVYSGNSNNRVYNFFKTDKGIFAFYAHQGGTAKKIFKYNVVNGEHRFDEVRDITINATTSDTKNYQQSDVNSSGTAISTRRLTTDFMRTESYDGYAYYTTGYLYKTKTFVRNETTAISAPNGAIITDLMVRDGVLYALGFVKTNATTNVYTNYVWSLDSSNKFTEIRSFTSTGAYALSFEMDSEFFYVGLGGPTTHVTTAVTTVGDIVKLAIEPISR
ncbi:MAG: hypothetical protein E7587_02960 [Ruminococcaceae bacterium]|nr:hypothetical protein [Oscillospiraceae bacterium]